MILTAVKADFFSRIEEKRSATVSPWTVAAKFKYIYIYRASTCDELLQCEYNILLRELKKMSEGKNMACLQHPVFPGGHPTKY